MHHISDIATDPQIQWQTMKKTPLINPLSIQPRYKAIGIREGLKIQVIVEPLGEGIITGYPLR